MKNQKYKKLNLTVAAVLLSGTSLVAATNSTVAQDTQQTPQQVEKLPEIELEAPTATPPAKPKKVKKKKKKKTPVAAAPVASQPVIAETPPAPRFAPGTIDTSTAPTASAKAAELAARPGSQTVVPSPAISEGKVANEQDLFKAVPGVFVVTPDPAPGHSFVSIRGSDIGERAGRRGRGVLSLIDGIPVGRSGSGTTSGLIDTRVLDYVEVYRGGNALQYGAAVTGGVINYIPRKGITFADGKEAAGSVSTEVGSFGYAYAQTEIGGVLGDTDYYVQWNGYKYDSYREHNESDGHNASGNIGIKINKNVDTRFYLSYTKSDTDLASAVPLNQLEELYKTSSDDSKDFDYDRNYEGWRFANKTNWLISPTTSLQFGAFGTYTEFDHHPTVFSGIVDNTWRGAGLYADLKTILEGPVVEHQIKTGIRLSGSRDDILRFQHADGGTKKGLKYADWDNETETVEAYIEDALALTDRTKLFVGAAAVYAHRKTIDNFTDLVVGNSVPFRGTIQPGSLPGIQEYDETFQGFSPKFGLTYDLSPNSLIYGNIAKSYEVPNDSDLSDVLRVNASNAAQLAAITLDLPKAQTAWTYEIGTRGKIADTFRWDLSLYYMDLDNEILTTCITAVDPTCNTTPAFNADSTVHRGVELAVGARLANALFQQEDYLELDVAYTYNDFYFDDDKDFGDSDLPLISPHVFFSELTYRHPSGFYIGGNITFMDERKVTFDGSGGDAYVVPDVTLLGAKVGYKSDELELFVQGDNLTDEIYTSTYAALPTVPTTRGRNPVPVESPSVRPGSPLSVTAGLKFKF